MDYHTREVICREEDGIASQAFEGPTVFSANKDDRPETATASLSSPCTTSGAKLLFAPTAAAPSVHWSSPAT